MRSRRNTAIRKLVLLPAEVDRGMTVDPDRDQSWGCSAETPERRASLNLAPGERERLTAMTKAGRLPARQLSRALILLLLDEGWAPVDLPEAVGCGIATVGRVRRRYEEEGLDRALKRGAKTWPAPPPHG